MAVVEHVLYDNEVLESKLDDLLETRLNAMNLMTVDNTLVANAGMRKVINTYTYEGAMKEVEIGEGNTEFGKVTFAAQEHEVKVYQQAFQYQDEQAMQDPKVVEVGLKGMAATMVKDLNTKFFEAINGATLTLNAQGAQISYADVVDAIAAMADIETGSLAGEGDAAGLFLLVGPGVKAGLRKDPDFMAARQGEILFNGQIGSICGMPIVESRSVQANTAYVMTKEAVTCFIKKESEVEQERDANTRTNTIYGRRVALVALTDATKIVKIVKTK